MSKQEHTSIQLQNYCDESQHVEQLCRAERIKLLRIKCRHSLRSGFSFMPGFAAAIDVMQLWRYRAAVEQESTLSTTQDAMTPDSSHVDAVGKETPSRSDRTISIEDISEHPDSFLPWR